MNGAFSSRISTCWRSEEALLGWFLLGFATDLLKRFNCSFLLLIQLRIFGSNQIVIPNFCALSITSHLLAWEAFCCLAFSKIVSTRDFCKIAKDIRSWKHYFDDKYARLHTAWNFCFCTPSSCTDRGDQLFGELLRAVPIEVEGLGANNPNFSLFCGLNLHSGASVMTVVTSLEKNGSMVCKVVLLLITGYLSLVGTSKWILEAVGSL